MRYVVAGIFSLMYVYIHIFCMGGFSDILIRSLVKWYD